MKYISTRGAAPALHFNEVLLAGLASDGGLYVPETIPAFGARKPGWYDDVAFRVVSAFIGSDVPDNILKELITGAYDSFGNRAVAPLTQIGDRLWLMELFHGPTLAFKDVALQLLGKLFGYVLQKQDRHVTIVGATSGDTGSAAIEAFRGSRHADIFIMLPHGRVSEVQRRQMTTVDAPNVHVIAVEGSFDDCQDMVKALFADRAFRDRVALSAVNSINWARIMAQIVYYASTSQAFLGKRVNYVVPSGNFGNAYAGHMARRMGAMVGNIVLASNANDVLTRIFETGAITLDKVVPTLSPAMDIQIPSNFERLLFELYDSDGKALAADMTKLRRDGRLTLTPLQHAALKAGFTASRVSDTDTLLSIAAVRKTSGILLDPHSAIAVHAAERSLNESEGPVVALATAHAAKFPSAVVEATGVTPELPPNLRDLMHRKETYTVLPNNIDRVRQFIDERVKA